MIVSDHYNALYPPKIDLANYLSICDALLIIDPCAHADLHGAGEDAKIHMSFLSKLEALASSSVRVAEKAAAKLLIVFTDTGLTSALVAKYRCGAHPSKLLVASRTLATQNLAVSPAALCGFGLDIHAGSLFTAYCPLNSISA